MYMYMYIHVYMFLMRDEKEERKKEASKVKQTQSNTAHPRQSYTCIIGENLFVKNFRSTRHCTIMWEQTQSCTCTLYILPPVCMNVLYLL